MSGSGACYLDEWGMFSSSLLGGRTSATGPKMRSVLKPSLLLLLLVDLKMAGSMLLVS